MVAGGYDPGMADDSTHPAAFDGDELLARCEVRHGRVRGPGGQRRNKVETAVTLKHRASGIEAHASERRTQTENLRVALFRLRLNLALEIRLPVDAAKPASELWRSRVQEGRIVLNPKHHDFPPMLAEALDMLAAAGMDPAAAAMALGCTTSQLVKLLKDEPRALAWLNAHRQRAGLRLMK